MEPRRIRNGIALAALALAALGGSARAEGVACKVTPGMFGPVGAPLYVKVPPTRPLNALKVGDKAPAFTLPSTSGDPVSLADFAGKKHVLLFFLPAAFTPV